MELEKLYSNLSQLDLVTLALDILENDLGEYIADLNRSQLADKGVGSDGSALTPEYSGLTEIMKQRRSGTAGIISHVTLFDTGELHNSIFVTAIGDSILLDSKDSKVLELTQKYGEFLGLTPESIEALQVKFMPIFEQKMYGKILE